MNSPWEIRFYTRFYIKVQGFEKLASLEMKIEWANFWLNFSGRWENREWKKSTVVNGSVSLNQTEKNFRSHKVINFRKLKIIQYCERIRDNSRFSKNFTSDGLDKFLQKIIFTQLFFIIFLILLSTLWKFEKFYKLEIIII